jgi:hypothetical protein
MSRKKYYIVVIIRRIKQRLFVCKNRTNLDDFGVMQCFQLVVQIG